jgi:hypothetical protein
VRSQSTQTATVVVALALVAFLSLFAQSHAGQRALTRLGIVGHSARYTALAFAQPLQLPAHLPRTPTPVDASFTITNRQGRAETYRWKVSANGAADQVLASGEVSLGAGQRAYVDPPLILTCSSAHMSVDVRLASGEYIDFLAQCAAGPRAASPARDVMPLLTPSRLTLGSRR